MQLFDWQIPIRDELLEKISANNTSVLACGTGIGKTYIAADAISRLSPAVRPLVMCPKSILATWRQVLQGFNVPFLDVLNWEKLKTGKTPWWSVKATPWNLPADAIIISDESHKGCSGPDTKTGAALATLKAYPVKKILVSATMASSPLQMRHTGYLLGLHDWNKQSWTRWLVENKCWFDRENRYWRAPRGRKGREVMAEINRRISGRLVYRKTTDVPGFPESVVQAKLYNLDERETKEIQEAWAEMSMRMKSKGANELAENNRARERTEWLKVRLMAELVCDALEQDLSPVVFLNYREPLFKLQEVLSTEKDVHNVSMIYGGQDIGSLTTNRDKQIAAFQSNENRVCLSMSQCGGIGISLHSIHGEYPRISYINPSYSASDVKQCLGRIHRVGGTNVVQILPLAAGTCEERVYRTVSAKLQNIDALNDADLVMQ